MRLWRDVTFLSIIKKPVSSPLGFEFISVYALSLCSFNSSDWARKGEIENRLMEIFSPPKSDLALPSSDLNQINLNQIREAMAMDSQIEYSMVDMTMNHMAISLNLSLSLTIGLLS